MRGIEGNQIVPKQKGTSFRESIELSESCCQVSFAVYERSPVITAHRGEAVNACVLYPYFEIDGKATRREIIGVRRFPGLIVHGYAEILLIQKRTHAQTPRRSRRGVLLAPSYAASFTLSATSRYSGTWSKFR